MPKHLQREIEHLKKMVLSLGAKVEDRVREATMAIDDRDARTAKKVIETDIEIDQAEVVIEEECLKILALHQPVAIDLRFIVAVLKINSDLERIADLAVNVAERAVFLATQPRLDISFNLRPMAQKAREMLRNSLDALVNLSETSALKAIESDSDVDRMNRQMFLLVQEGIKRNPNDMESLIHILSASRNLERISDHATNIAEDVLYMTRGEVMRHKTSELERKPLQSDNGVKTRVLFICVHNSARSQMAEAFLKKYGGDRFSVESAGLEPGTLNPVVVEVMKEVGIDISHKTTNSVFDFFRQGRLYDYVITVCDAAQSEKCPIFPGVAKRIHWSFPDPSAFNGSHEDKLQRIRQVRDQIEQQIKDWIRSI